MKIIELTGVTKSNEITVSKGISSLIIATSLALTDFLNEKISIYIERANGNNVPIANKVKLQDFLLSATYGGEAIHSDGAFPTIAVCEIALEGAILLQEKENIKISLEDLRAPNTYIIYGVEHPLNTNNLMHWEQKSCAIEDLSKKIDVKGYDLAVIDLNATVTDISYTYSNGQTIKYDPFELRALSVDVDPIQSIESGSVSSRIGDKLCLPLVNVDFIDVNKNQGSIVNFVMRSVKTEA
jgi:hypothetical protein